MADTADIHPTDGRRRREKGPPSRLALPRLERVSDTECGQGFDEDLDSTEYHDANDTTEETTRKEETEADASVQRSTGFQGGFGSSSLKECIELLNTTTKIAPAPLDSGVGNSADPQQKMAEQGSLASPGKWGKIWPRKWEKWPEIPFLSHFL